MKNLILLVFLLGVKISTFSQNEYLLKLHSFNGESPKTAFSEIKARLKQRFLRLVRLVVRIK